MEIERAKRDTTSLRDWKADIGRLVATGVLTVVALAVAGWTEGASAAWIALGVAVLAFVLVLAAEFAWNLLMAPGRIAHDENIRLRKEYTVQLGERDAVIAERKAKLDEQRPKLLLMQQLVKSDDLLPQLILYHGGTEDELRQRFLTEARAILEWDRRTQSILKKYAPQFRTEYVAGMPRPLGIGATPPPTTGDLRGFLTQRREALSRIIRSL
jgi:hypothetical protein